MYLLTVIAGEASSSSSSLVREQQEVVLSSSGSRSRSPTSALLVMALASLVVLEPVEDVLALDLAEGTEVGGDGLDLVGAGGSEPRAEEISQHLDLFCGWVPAPALGPNSGRTEPVAFVHILPSSPNQTPIPSLLFWFFPRPGPL